MLERILMSSQSSRKSHAYEDAQPDNGQQDRALPASSKAKLTYDGYRRMREKFESKESLTCEKVVQHSRHL